MVQRTVNPEIQTTRRIIRTITHIIRRTPGGATRRLAWEFSSRTAGNGFAKEQAEKELDKFIVKLKP